ncbi:MAG: M23 family metallopeptidase, partial [Bacteroidaceae bacterium]|nr:M23 family metallopeptidase [Bacteroidaceae bacterium]
MLAMVGVSGMAQDLIAMQAPSDKRMKEIRDVKLTHTLKTDLQNPASDIYTDWRNEFVSAVAGHVPTNFKVDLRGFCMPTTSRVVTSNFGPRWRRQHAGIDVKVYIGDTIRAAFDGKVRITKYDRRGYGYFVVIRHPNGLETLYGHLSKIIAKEDAVVKAGDIIGLGGNTGRSTGSHLHFETRLLGQAINPAFMFDFEKQDVTSDFYVCNNKAMTRGKEDLMDIEQMENEVALREGSVLISTGISEQSIDEDNNENVVDVKQSKKSKTTAKNERRHTEKAKNGVHIVK